MIKMDGPPVANTHTPRLFHCYHTLYHTHSMQRKHTTLGDSGSRLMMVEMYILSIIIIIIKKKKEKVCISGVHVASGKIHIDKFTAWL